MAKKKRIKRISSQTPSENSTKTDSSIIKALSFAEASQNEKQDISTCTCSKKPVTRRIFLLSCFSSCMSAEPCPVHPNEQRKKNKKQRRKKGKKNQGKNGEKKSDKLESDIKQEESLLQSIQHSLFEEKTSDQTRADQTPACETSPAEGKLLTDDLRNKETVTPKVTEKTVSEESVTTKVTEETEQYSNEDPMKSEGPQVTENKSSGDDQSSYCWSESDEPTESIIFNAESFEIPGVPRRENDRGLYEDWVKLKSILLTGLAMGDHQGAEDKKRHGINTNEELPIWQRKRTRHIQRLY